MITEMIVTMPPDVVRILASSTVFVKASSLVNLDLGGMVVVGLEESAGWALATALGSGQRSVRYRCVGATGKGNAKETAKETDHRDCDIRCMERACMEPKHDR